MAEHSTTSSRRRPMKSPICLATARKWSWVWGTSLGWPVVPEVTRIRQTSSPLAWAATADGASLVSPSRVSSSRTSVAAPAAWAAARAQWPGGAMTRDGAVSAMHSEKSDCGSRLCRGTATAPIRMLPRKPARKARESGRASSTRCPGPTPREATTAPIRRTSGSSC